MKQFRINKGQQLFLRYLKEIRYTPQATLYNAMRFACGTRKCDSILHDTQNWVSIQRSLYSIIRPFSATHEHLCKLWNSLVLTVYTPQIAKTLRATFTKEEITELLKNPSYKWYSFLTNTKKQLTLEEYIDYCISRTPIGELELGCFFSNDFMLAHHGKCLTFYRRFNSILNTKIKK